MGNYYKPGPATRSDVRDRIANPSARGDDDHGSWYAAENHVEGTPEVTADNWQGMDGDSFTKLTAPWEAMPIRQQSPQDAYLAVLDHAGCSHPNRDSVDARIVEEVRDGVATFGNHGIITTPADVGGWPDLQSAEAPQDGSWGTAAIPLNAKAVCQDTGNKEADRTACVGDFNNNSGFMSRHSGGGQFALGDGSVRFVAETVDLVVYRGAATVNGGEVTTLP